MVWSACSDCFSGKSESSSSNPNRHNLSRCATTISETCPDKTSSNKALNPFRLKLSPLPTSSISSWFGYRVFRCSSWEFKSSFWFRVNLNHQDEFHRSVRIVLILPSLSHRRKVAAPTPSCLHAALVLRKTYWYDPVTGEATLCNRIQLNAANLVTGTNSHFYHFFSCRSYNISSYISITWCNSLKKCPES